MKKVRILTKKATQIRVSQIRSRQIRASQIRASQMRASQMRATEISSNHRELHGAIFCECFIPCPQIAVRFCCYNCIPDQNMNSQLLCSICSVRWKQMGSERFQRTKHGVCVQTEALHGLCDLASDSPEGGKLLSQLSLLVKITQPFGCPISS